MDTLQICSTIKPQFTADMTARKKTILIIALTVAVAVSLIKPSSAFFPLQKPTSFQPSSRRHVMTSPCVAGWTSNHRKVKRGTLLFSSSDLYDSTIQPNRLGFLKKGFQWGVFGSVVVGLGQAFHVAAANQWLNIGESTWTGLSIAYPIIVVLACLYNLKFVFEGTAGGAQFVIEKMGGYSNKNTRLDDALEEVYMRSNLKGKPPSLYVISSSEPNAFAAGTNDNSVVAVTTALLNMLNPDEVRAVLAHEVGHIRNKDVETNIETASMIAALGFVMSCGGLILDLTRGMPLNSRRSNDDEEDNSNSIQAVGLILYIVGALSYFLGILLRLSSSRGAEFAADAYAKSIGAGPDLVSALERIHGKEDSTTRDSLGAMNGAFAHAYISNPPSRENPLISLFGLLSTHPEMERRIKKLLE